MCITFPRRPLPPLSLFSLVIAIRDIITYYLYFQNFNNNRHPRSPEIAIASANLSNARKRAEPLKTRLEYARRYFFRKRKIFARAKSFYFIFIPLPVFSDGPRQTAKSDTKIRRFPSELIRKDTRREMRNVTFYNEGRQTHPLSASFLTLLFSEF